MWADRVCGKCVVENAVSRDWAGGFGEAMAKILIYEMAVHEIVNLIRKLELRPGDKLPTEREMVKRLKVSRACIREALQVLASNYLVTIKRGSGIYVNVIDEVVMKRYLGKESTKEELLSGIKDIVEMRKILETYGFQQAAKTITSEQLHRLYSHEANEYATYLSDEGRSTGASMDFEHLILSCQPNVMLTSTHGRMGETWKRYMLQLNVVALPPDTRHRDHLGIIMAVEKNSPKQIAKAVAMHLDGTIDAVERMMAEG